MINHVEADFIRWKDAHDEEVHDLLAQEHFPFRHDDLTILEVMYLRNEIRFSSLCVLPHKSKEGEW
jgi:hypothetical protein